MDFLCCLCDNDRAPALSPHHTYGVITEKPSPYPPIHRTVEETAENIIDILLAAEKSGPLLSAKLDDAVFATGWSEWLAKNILKKLEEVLRDGREKMGPAMAEAYDQASKAAEITFSDLFEYVKEHPVEIAATVLLSLLAFGVLVRLMPVALELLGFGELGPTAGSFASWWQSTYGGYVPAESLFSFFQRLGMIWAKVQ
ncbi:hypothetical protein N5P37_004541 [Trichoderma harzianum]|uniref:Uncharacterized protein n=1 Tax=Trichoderma harzianum CBS 226.95 TaxID=983964 RepID=A0A2T3ZSN9_TRIHA|nr:hypothetical protein M431DRAFT_101404 [Trichoderma harzianum CBS 226.95]KAK0761742.1 hypothetical protein N5P37_004541 [Trichoderma harzianum]PKK52637.1 hypothetical protein CI102_2865 [Trichoderma harzianum]PTB47810.1 hypothetical protein M431DRAFT_101404 [Trichoderma harzianum CBS 226.95]